MQKGGSAEKRFAALPEKRKPADHRGSDRDGTKGRHLIISVINQNCTF
jgi:hypothetical protein